MSAASDWSDAEHDSGRRPRSDGHDSEDSDRWLDGSPESARLTRAFEWIDRLEPSDESDGYDSDGSDRWLDRDPDTAAMARAFESLTRPEPSPGSHRALEQGAIRAHAPLPDAADMPAVLSHLVWRARQYVLAYDEFAHYELYYDEPGRGEAAECTHGRYLEEDVAAISSMRHDLGVLAQTRDRARRNPDPLDALAADRAALETAARIHATAEDFGTREHTRWAPRGTLAVPSLLRWRCSRPAAPGPVDEADALCWAVRPEDPALLGPVCEADAPPWARRRPVNTDLASVRAACHACHACRASRREMRGWTHGSIAPAEREHAHARFGSDPPAYERYADTHREHAYPMYACAPHHSMSREDTRVLLCDPREHRNCELAPRPPRLPVARALF